MRAALLEEWPDLTEMFGIGPTNFQDYSDAELSVYLSAVRERRRLNARLLQARGN